MTEHDYKFRKARAARINELIGEAEAQAGPAGRVSILDMGGTRDYWHHLPELWRNRAVDITIVNLNAEPARDGQFTIAPGNACHMPEIGDQSFDIVHSNSVIEHVGSWASMAAKAAEIRRIGRSYYVQTPNRGFPLEPHYKLPMVHWLPEELRARALMKITGQLPPGSAIDDAMRRVQSIYLLSTSQMRSLFPDAAIVFERYFGLKKSIMAVKRHSPVPGDAQPASTA